MFIKVSLSAILVIATLFYFGECASNISAFINLHRTRRQNSCRQDEFACGSSQCISSYDKCDGVRHCRDGSDETSAACKTPGVGCPLLSFECAYGACVAQRLRCDGKDDCADGSDERDCGGQVSPQQVHHSPIPASPCRNDQFQCSNGQCVSEYDICDGVSHCSDGSDETANVCLNYVCPTRSFKCSYGACLKISLRCDGRVDCADGSDEPTNCPRYPVDPTTTTDRPQPPVLPAAPPAPEASNCRLPNHPKNGAYTAFTDCVTNDLRPACLNTPGVVVPSSWLLKYTCNSGFNLNRDSGFSICENGVWEKPIDCIKLCPPLRSSTVNVRCIFKGVDVNCTLPMKPDTQAVAECKPHYRQTSWPEYSALTCLKSGQWSYRLFTCSPECGLSSNAVPLISGPGKPVSVGEFPWLAAIYRIKAQRWDQQCGGTLITTHIVVTAAHCLVNNNNENKPLHPTEVRVGLGKSYRDYYIKEASSRIFEVRVVVLPDQYAGAASQYAKDIGLIDLMISVQVTSTIMPACFDWSTTFEPRPTDVGVVAGWGKMGDGLESSEVALSARLRFIEYSDCVRNLPGGTALQVTHDKFCAGNVDGSQPERGDSGGGLTFMNDGRHFLIGIVSTKIAGNRLFLDLTKREHSSWLERERDRLRQSHSEQL